MFLVSPKASPMLRGVLALGVATAASLSCVVAQDTVPDPMTDPAVGNAGAPVDVPGKECEPYYYETVANALESFPAVWDAATILSEDTNALTKWASIQPNVPDIPPKGTALGDFSDVSYGADDPDCWWTYSKCNDPKVADIPRDVSAMDEPRTLGFSFDDGPNCSHNAFYNYLKEKKQKATMFFIGSNVMDWPLETLRALEDGHEICVHSWSHRYMTALESSEAFAELYYSMQAIKLVAGVTPTCWRPPFGDVDDRIRAIANGLGLRTVLWEYDSQDWQVGASAGFTAEQVDKEYESLIEIASNGTFNDVGTMFLMHELNEFTMSQVMKYYPKLKEVFKYIVPVATGLNITQPYIESGHAIENFAKYAAGIDAQPRKNRTSTTVSATASTASTSQSSPPGPVVTNQLDAIKKTADASRVGGMNLFVVLVAGFICIAMV